MVLLITLLVGLIAWFFSTLVAGGAATFALPILGVLLGVNVAIPAITIAAIISNPFKAILFWQHINWRVALYLITGSIIGASVGAMGFSSFPTYWIEIIVGVFLVSTLASILPVTSRWKLPPIKLWHFIPLGTVVSFISAIAGGMGPILNPFLMKYGVRKEQLIATKSINSLVMQLTKIAAYMSLGVFTQHTFQYGVTLGIGAVLGTWLAKKKLINISSNHFEQYVTLFMVFIGFTLFIKGLIHIL